MKFRVRGLLKKLKILIQGKKKIPIFKLYDNRMISSDNVNLAVTFNSVIKFKITYLLGIFF